MKILKMLVISSIFIACKSKQDKLKKHFLQMKEKVVFL